MKKVKRIMAILLSAALMLNLVGCSSGGNAGNDSKGKDSSDSGKYKDTIIIGTALDITTTDPQGSNTDSNMMLFYLTHETLVELDPKTGKVIPGLAEYEIVDGNTFKFKLPKDATFTDGTPCTAKDVKFTLERAMKSSFTSPKVKLISNIEVANDQELTVTISKPSQEFLMNLAHKSLSILSEKAVTADKDKGPSLGTGMYSLQEWINGDHTSVVRYEGYRKGPAKTRCIQFKIMKEDSARVIALQTGEIDICVDPPAVELDHISSDSKLSLVQIPNVVMLYLTMNNTKEPFNNKLVRQAIAHAIDKESLIVAGYNGLGSVHNSMINRGQFGLDKSNTGYKYDLEKAKALLKEAGYPNGFTFKLAYNGSAKGLMAQVIQENLSKIGVKVVLEEMESPALKSMLNEHNHEAALYQWTDADGTDFTVRSMYYTGSGSNRSLISDKTLDKMIDDALVEADPDVREKMYNKIDQYVTELCPIVPICTSMINVGISKKVQGVVWMSNAKHDYRGVYIAE